MGRGSAAQRRLSETFEQRLTDKRYTAVVHGDVRASTGTEHGDPHVVNTLASRRSPPGSAQFRLVMIREPDSAACCCCWASYIAWKLTSVSKMGGNPARVQRPIGPGDR
jgi:hypothetical protein